MNSNTVLFIVFLVCIIKLSSTYQDTDEIDPSMDFFDYQQEIQNRRTSIVYLDATEEPLRIVYKRRKLKKKKKLKKKNRKTRLQRTKYNELEKEEQEVMKPEPYKVKRGKKGRKGKKVKVKKNVPKDVPQFKTWEGIVFKGKNKNKEPSKLSKSFDGDPEMRKPVDIIVHIKMKE